MSKMFEALRKTEGDMADVAKAVLADETAARKAVDALTISGGTVLPAEDLSASQRAVGGEVRTVTIDLPPKSPIFPFDGSDDRAAEQYKIIRTKIQHHRSQPRTVLVSSAMPGDGKTISAINVAAALALQENLRVVLLDCDFRRSTATRELGLAMAPGLAEVLRNEVSLEAALVRVSQFPNLYVLPPGGVSSGPAELLSTNRWQGVLEMLRSEFRFLVIDAPPVGAVAEYELLQMAADAVVLVMRQDHTNRQLWQKALKTVPKAKQLGVIVNCAEQWFLWKTHSYYYYSSNEA